MAVKKSKTTAAKKKSPAKKKTTASAKKAVPVKKTVTKGTIKARKPVSKIVKHTENSTSVKPNGKTYLTDKDLKFFTGLIIEQKNEILENARRLRESLIDNTGDYVGDNSTFSMHMAEQGSDEMEREKTYMLIQRDEKHLFYLENALERIGKKTYGLCISCGKTISKARLEAVPITSHCINCKQNLSS
ncbi:MAG: TraR/DksA C4-type zinc finger protein [Ignavibacteria bacterium]|nr:TraR/DksA C4-type zinc finger protein [Ignavibacteria bacterium]MCC7158741.1 TraR/DksA C4-type zinc finger protein [Ignavibacteria bacterium]